MQEPGAILAPGQNCWRKVQANRATPLVDGAAYFDALTRAALIAERSIIIIGWGFYSRIQLCPEPVAPGVPTRLGDFLNYLAKRRRGLRIYVLDWDFPVLFGLDQQIVPIFYQPWNHHRRIKLRHDNRIPAGACHHQKLLVIDDAVAFCGGIDLTRGRWDTPCHRADEPGRQFAGQCYPALHDLMIMVDGEAAQSLGKLARQQWRRATGQYLSSMAVVHNPWPQEVVPWFEEVTVGIARTAPLFQDQAQVLEIEHLYEDTIARAQRFIYIESQYFTSKHVGESLAASLQALEGPEVILVLNYAGQGWLASDVMNVLRSGLIQRLRQADHYGRLNIYYPIVPGHDDNGLHVHSKLCIIDDWLLRIGSANVSNRSMIQDTECDVVIETGSAEHLRERLRDFRNYLLAEHLGSDAATVSQTAMVADSVAGTIEQLKGGERTLQVLEDIEQRPASWGTLSEMVNMERPVSLEELTGDMAADDNGGNRRLGLWVKIGVGLLVLAGLFAAWRWTALQDVATLENALSWASYFERSPWAPLFVLIAYIIISIIMFPRPLLSISIVLVFGPWLGFFYIVGGITLSALTNYGVGRFISRDTLSRLVGKRLNRISQELSQRGFWYVVGLRMIPLGPFFVVNMVAGAVRVRVHHFTLATIIGMAPEAVIATVFGNQAMAIMADGKQANIALLVGVLVGLGVVFYLIYRWR